MATILRYLGAAGPSLNPTSPRPKGSVGTWVRHLGCRNCLRYIEWQAQAYKHGQSRDWKLPQRPAAKPFGLRSTHHISQTINIVNNQLQYLHKFLVARSIELFSLVYLGFWLLLAWTTQRRRLGDPVSERANDRPANGVVAPATGSSVVDLPTELGYIPEDNESQERKEHSNQDAAGYAARRRLRRRAIQGMRHTR